MAIPLYSTGSQASRRPLKVGLFVPFLERSLDGVTPRWADILALARGAEALGFDSVWFADHLLYRLPGQETTGMWEGWSVVSALAAATTRVEIGTLVTCTGFRNPALLAKMADTVDEISGGRLILGLGAGYHEPEFRAFGLPHDRLIARFGEALALIATLLREGAIDFQGQYYTARGCVLRPRGPRPTGPPIMVGGHGPRVQRLVARHADLWNLWLPFHLEGGNFVSHPDQLAIVRPFLGAIDAACEAERRDPATLGRTATLAIVPPGQPVPSVPPGGTIPVSGSAEEIAAVLRGLALAGIGHLQVNLRLPTLAALEAFAPVLERLDRGA